MPCTQPPADHQVIGISDEDFAGARSDVTFVDHFPAMTVVRATYNSQKKENKADKQLHDHHVGSH